MSGLEAALEDLLYNYKSTTWKTAAPRQNRSQYSKRKRIHSLETVRKKTLYGMHMESFMFIKVVLYDPNDVKRVAAILEVCFAFFCVRVYICIDLSKCFQSTHFVLYFTSYLALFLPMLTLGGRYSWYFYAELRIPYSLLVAVHQRL